MIAPLKNITFLCWKKIPNIHFFGLFKRVDELKTKMKKKKKNYGGQQVEQTGGQKGHQNLHKNGVINKGQQ